MFYTVFVYKNGLIICMKKGMQKVYKKLLAHPLFISDYVVYYARVARTFILVSLLCVCYTIIWIDQIKCIKRCKERRFSLQHRNAICHVV